MKYHISSSLFVLFCIVLCACNSSSVEKDGIIQPAFDLIERQIGERAADIQLEEIAPENGKETFEVEAKNGTLTLRGSSSVAICYAFHTYLREACSAMKTWSGEHMELPETWPDFSLKKQTTPYEYRYFLNVCTFGYTTPYWDWERWEKEIDWMAMHGINMPLSITGMEVVWYNLLKRIGYTTEEINEFISGPAFMAWWQMNNLEGWGGPNPDSWYRQQEALQKKIITRMRELGIEPVFPGYAGMVPRNIGEKLGYQIADPGKWCGFPRPAFLSTEDEHFDSFAAMYYEELEKLYGKAKYYSMDPFHEGGNTEGVDLAKAGTSIMSAMKKANPEAVWVMQAWQANPREAMVSTLDSGDLLVLDLYSEKLPQWGDPESMWYREKGFGKHDWLYCMLLNYGGNVGLHGKMKHVIDEFYKAKTSSFGKTMKGVGMTMEGSENNSVMFELLCELPWRPARFDKDEWLKNYTVARYGKADKAVQDAWLLLSNTIYNCPAKNTQQGTHESVFCGRPDYDVYQVSSWSEMEPYYKPEDIIRAAGIMLSAADRFKGNNNFEYDLIDIVRQAVAEKGRLVYPIMIDAYKAGEKELFAASSQRFLDLILLQDKLLAARPEFKVGTWIEKARNLGTTPEEKDLYEWNARVQVTTWGNRVAADEGGLRDYAHKEWNGLLRDFYYNRWKVWIDRQKAQLNGAPVKAIDFYAIEEPWTKQTNPYSSQAEGDVIEVAKEVYAKITE